MTIYKALERFEATMNAAGIEVATSTVTKTKGPQRVRPRVTVLVHIVLRFPDTLQDMYNSAHLLGRVVDKGRTNLLLMCSICGVPMDSMNIYIDAISPRNTFWRPTCDT